MKTKLIIGITFGFLVGCVLAKKVEYNIPENISKENHDKFIYSFNQGKALYNASCANCHTKKTNGIEKVPTFSKEQLESYKIRSLNQSHSEELTPMTITEPDLTVIMIYLLNKK